jgi:DNA-binding MarR family transcriptional regulator
MVEEQIQNNQDRAREELLQHVIEQIFSMMKHIHRDVLPKEPVLSPPQARLIFTIARNKEEGISVKELASKVNMTPGAVTQFIDGLIEKGLVSREEDLYDRRIVRLKVTQSAINQMEKFRKDFLRSASRTFEVLSLEELRQLNGLLIKVSSETSNKHC